MAEEETPVSVTELVTPEILAAVLKSVNRPELEIVDFEATEATAAGDNYMAILIAVKLRLKNRNSAEIEVHPIMLKMMPKNEFRRQCIRDGKIFLKEVRMYQEVLPAMEKFQRDLGLPEAQIWTPWPRCYGGKTDGENDYLAMEDLKVSGFKMADRKVGLDLEHCELLMRSLAKFHAVTYAMFGGDFDKIMEEYPWLEDCMFREDKLPDTAKDFMQTTFNQHAAMVREAGEEKGAALMEKIYSDSYFNEMYAIVGAKVKWAVIGHGDCWINNFLFRYEEGKPVDVKFVDFQVSRACSRTIDIHNFLYSSPKTEILNGKETEMEDAYFEEFTRFAERLGVNVAAHELTKENFEKEVAKHRIFGVVMGILFAMVLAADASDVQQMESITKEDFESGEASTIMAKLKKEAGVERIRNIAAHHLPRCEQMRKHLDE